MLKQGIQIKGRLLEQALIHVCPFLKLGLLQKLICSFRSSPLRYENTLKQALIHVCFFYKIRTSLKEKKLLPPEANLFL